MDYVNPKTLTGKTKEIIVLDILLTNMFILLSNLY